MADTVTLQDMYKAALTLSREDRQQLQKMLIDQLRRETFMEFGPGDKVKFTESRTGAVIQGTVIRVNGKSVKITSAQDRYGNTAPRNVTWTVPPSMVQAA